MITEETEQRLVESIVAQRDRSEADIARLTAERDEAVAIERKRCLQILELYWTFDNDQQHTHSWHSMQDAKDKVRSGKTLDRFALKLIAEQVASTPTYLEKCLQLTAERDTYEGLWEEAVAALEFVRSEFQRIDSATSWRASEPEWWLAFSAIDRRAAALPRGPGDGLQVRGRGHPAPSRPREVQAWIRLGTPGMARQGPSR